jgi:DNA ligase 1
MNYLELCNVYEALEDTSKGLEKTSILSDFLEEIKEIPDYIYLLQGKVFADYDRRELGMSIQLVIKSISKASGFSEEEVVNEFREKGDLGEVAYDLVGKRKQQSSLFSEKLSISKVFESLFKITTLEGKGTVSTKISLVVDLLHSSSAKEAKYIVRTILTDLKIGVGGGLLRDAIVDYHFKPENIEDKKKFSSLVQSAYDMSTDWSLVFEKTIQNRLNDISLSPGRPVKVMLYPKAKGIEDAFKIVGKPAALEYKYDGFRMMINKDENGNIKIFTRRLDEVSNQFPDVVELIKNNVKAKTFIIDCEAIGYNPETKKYTEFQDISQRIRRKYDIDKIIEKLPVELRVFDIIFYEGENLTAKSYEERWVFLKKIIPNIKFKIGLAERIITDSVEEAEVFFTKALDDNQEGLMVKGLDKPYKPGSRIGYAVKWKPEDNDLDLVIVGAEWGTGKRAGWLTSFDLACKDGDELKMIGKASTGLKEKKEEGFSFEELTELLKDLVIEESGRKVFVKPEIVVTIRFQNVQKSSTHSSGYALRFPRITRLRPDRGTQDVATIEEVKLEAE